jgi:hypothetical protein
MRKTLVLFLFTCLFISAAPIIVDAPKILSFAEKCLSHEGPLNRTEEGFVYVKVSDDYIFETLKLLGDNAIKAPPYFGKGKVGAHISVIYADEMKNRIPILPHLGKAIAFKIVNFAKVDMRNKNENKCIYLFTVESPELERIRAINDLPSNRDGNEFHITVGVKKLEIKPRS